MKSQTLLLLVLLALGSLAFVGCNGPLVNHRGDDSGPTRGPLSATSQDIKAERAYALKHGETADEFFNPSRW